MSFGLIEMCNRSDSEFLEMQIYISLNMLILFESCRGRPVQRSFAEDVAFIFFFFFFNISYLIFQKGITALFVNALCVQFPGLSVCGIFLSALERRRHGSEAVGGEAVRGLSLSDLKANVH